MTAEHYVIFSDVIRRANQVMRAVEDLAPNDPVHAAAIARDLQQTLRTAQAKLSKIKLPAVRASRWQGVKRPNQLSAANGRS